MRKYGRPQTEEKNTHSLMNTSLEFLFYYSLPYPLEPPNSVFWNNAQAERLDSVHGCSVATDSGPVQIFNMSLVKSQKGVILFSNVPLRTRRTLSPYNVYGNNTFLVLNRTLLYNVNVLLVLIRQCIGLHSTLLEHVLRT